MSDIGKDVKKAALLLQKGEVIAVPTETVYGLAGNALIPETVIKIFEIKQRPFFDPLIIHLPDKDSLAKYVLEIPVRIRPLMEAFMPGPLTLLLPKRDEIPDIVTAGSPLVAVRIPAHPLMLELLGMVDFPIAAPSANPFGYISPTTAEHVDLQLGEKIPYILDGGPCQIGVESTIIGMEEDKIIIYRKGGIAIEDIESIVGEVIVKAVSSSNPLAPGMLESHYAPRIPLSIIDASEKEITEYDIRTSGILCFQKYAEAFPIEHQRILSPTGNMSEAAKNLFAMMRELDALPLKHIYAELLPESGLGRAINDRLRRASCA